MNKPEKSIFINVKAFFTGNIYLQFSVLGDESNINSFIVICVKFKKYILILQTSTIYAYIWHLLQICRSP